jgi:hypothetical protein
MKTADPKPRRPGQTRAAIRRLLAAVEKSIQAAREAEKARVELLAIAKKKRES